MSQSPRFILVGHCGADSWMLSRAIEQAVPGAEILEANSDDDLASYAGDRDVWLVNRVLDGRFRSGSGIDFIRQATNERPNVTAALISNYADAQDKAEEAGAMPGFGKSALDDPKTAELLRSLTKPTG